MKQLLSILLLVAVSTTAGLAQDKVYRYEKGKDYKYFLEETSMTIQEVQGQTISSNNESTVSAIISITGIRDNGDMEAIAKIENALIVSESGNSTQSLGSDFAGKSAHYVFSSLGKIVDIDTNDTKDLEAAGGMLHRIMDFLPQLNPDKLSDGASWERTTHDTTGGGDNTMYITTEREYEVKGKKKIGMYDCLKILVESKAKIKGKMTHGDQEMNIQGTQEGTGTIYYATVEGLLVEMEMETSGDQVVVVSSMNMRIPITSNSTVKFELSQK